MTAKKSLTFLQINFVLPDMFFFNFNTHQLMIAITKFFLVGLPIAYSCLTGRKNFTVYGSEKNMYFEDKMCFAKKKRRE